MAVEQGNPQIVEIILGCPSVNINDKAILN